MLRARVTATAAGALVLAVTACATAPSGGGSPGTRSDVIAAAELAQHLDEDLYTLIQRARPTWLQTRAPISTQSAPVIVIVVDGVPQEPGLDPLRGFKVGDVREVRRLSASDATTRFGTGMGAGAILVTTKR
ncbi:MAG: hypothetical protein FIB01_04490 [Gemmatimonadetes bacterium]|nr:hypothetical protein [Gemmatimonadota bacterium]